MTGPVESSAVDLTACDREPIHTPNAIQPFGLLVVLSESRLEITHVSGNSRDWLAVDPNSLLGNPVSELVGPELAAAIRAGLPQNERQYRTLSGRVVTRQSSFEASITVHRFPAGFILEIERAEDPKLAGQLFEQQWSVLGGLEHVSSPEALTKAAVEEISRATGYARVMCYRFDEHWNGEVVQEVTNGVPKRYLGHHFPHSDIPAQARELYLRNRVRVIPDVGYEPVPLVSNPARADLPPNLSDSVLRAVSPVHIQYLKNMAVFGTLAMSLVVEGRLWGMIVCHHDQPKSVPQSLRRFCDSLARMTGLHLESALRAQNQRETERLLGALADFSHALQRGMELKESIAAHTDTLLHTFDSQALVLSIAGEQYSFGKAVSTGKVDQLCERAGLRGNHEIAAADSTGELVFDTTDPDWIAGYLFLPISSGGDEYCIWLREERVSSIPWGGRPHKGEMSVHERLTPRVSFELWLEEVRGRSAPWSLAERGAAERLGEFLRLQLAGEVRQSRAREQALRRMAMHDDLTGLPNRSLLVDRLRQEMRKARRANTCVVLLFVDLDRFKPINDIHGHRVGDAVLKRVASRLADAVRESDTVARVGGDEFIVLAPVSHRPGEANESARVLAGKVAAAAVRPVKRGRAVHTVGCSIGIAVYPDLDLSADELMRTADHAMYEAKRVGGNTFRIAGPHSDAGDGLGDSPS
ncbi:diguanylate cyclase [Ectothiorhodospiraceae bacterium WFHF3C12]|nr:diguanylate cyclase [Ectothiorhodospiraceae bacterium WFHF3C12]